MLKRLAAGLVLTVACGGALAASDKPTRFWNLTFETVTHLYLAPAGTERWGGDECRNDPDGSVDFDERLRLNPLASGRYDVKLADKSGRSCLVRNVDIKAGAVFSIGKEEPKECGR